MATKQATNFFSHDSNARNDQKLLRLRMRHGAAGYGVYFMILERLREETNYMSVKDYNTIAFDLRVDARLIKSVVEDFGLFAFTEDGKCFYSDAFLKRMEGKSDAARKLSEAGKAGMRKRWAKNNTSDNNDTTSETNETNENTTSSDEKPEQEKNSLPDVNDDFLSRFFRKTNQENIEIILMNFGLKPDELEKLKELAREVVSEWKATDTSHNDYSDWSRHLVATMRIKLRKNTENEQKPTERSAASRRRGMEAGIPAAEEYFKPFFPPGKH